MSARHLFVILILALSLALIGCSSKKKSSDDIAKSLEDRLTDAMDIDGATAHEGAPPTGRDDPSAPQINEIDATAEMRLGSDFAVSLFSSFDTPSEVDKTIIYVKNATQYLVVNKPLSLFGAAWMVKLTGSLSDDATLADVNFQVEYALQTRNGLTGAYKSRATLISSTLPDCGEEPCCNGGIWVAEGGICRTGDELTCTEDRCDSAHACVSTLAEQTCLIDDACLLPYDLNPENECEKCWPEESVESWSYYNDKACDAGNGPESGYCSEGLCLPTASDGDTETGDPEPDADPEEDAAPDGDDEAELDLEAELDSEADLDDEAELDSEAESEEELVPEMDVESSPVFTEFVPIHSNSFLRGSYDGSTCPPPETGCELEQYPAEPGRRSDETMDRVQLTIHFEMAVNETTQGEFRTLLSYNPSPESEGGDLLPVQNVNWHEAAAYANALSIHRGFDTCYDCTGTGTEVACLLKTLFNSPQNCPGYRLPTEAEWEYAAEANGTASLYTSPGNNGVITETTCTPLDANLNQIAWYCGNNNIVPMNVRTKEPNDFGLYDMLGNVREWVGDEYSTYNPDQIIDPAIRSTGLGTVLRGGSYASNAADCRPAARDYADAATRSPMLGFRLVRTIPPVRTPDSLYLRIVPTEQIECYGESDNIMCPSYTTPPDCSIIPSDCDVTLVDECFCGQDAQYADLQRYYSCYNASGNYDSCGTMTTPLENETVIEDLNGLIWQRTFVEDRTWWEALEYCTTTLNNAVYGGGSDWRLPDIHELRSLMVFSRTYPNIDTTAFPDTPAVFFWTASRFETLPYAAGFDLGGVERTESPDGMRAVRCVRGGPDMGARSAPRFVERLIGADAVVYDSVTGLTWRATGLSVNSWQPALASCEGSTLGEHNDWRLPNIHELYGLVRPDRESPASDFPGLHTETFYSSTTDLEYGNQIWAVRISDGSALSIGKTEPAYALCVRGTP